MEGRAAHFRKEVSARESGRPYGWGGTCGGGTLSLATPFHLPVEGPVALDRDGWLQHRVPGVLPDDADTAHGVQVFDMYSVVITTSNPAHENKQLERGYG